MPIKRVKKRATKKLNRTCSTCNWTGTRCLCNLDLACTCIGKGPKHSYLYWQLSSGPPVHRIREGERFVASKGNS